VKGKVIRVTISLPVKGTYSATSPWTCEKTQAMIADETKAILKMGLFSTKRDKSRHPKGGTKVPPISSEDLKALEADAEFNPTKLTVKELLTALEDWSVVVRSQAAEEPGKRDDDVVKQLLAMLQSPNGYARGITARIYPQLKEDDLKHLWGAIYHASKKPAPSGAMAADGVRLAGANLLAKHRTKEGLEIAREYVFGTPGYVWGTYGRYKSGMPNLKVYDQGLKEHFPEMESFIKRVEGYTKKPDGEGKRTRKTMAKVTVTYEEMQKTPLPTDLKSIRPYIDAFYKELATEFK